MSGSIGQALRQLSHALEESGVVAEKVGLIVEPGAYADLHYALCREVGPLKWVAVSEDVSFMGFKILRARARSRMTDKELLDVLKARLNL